MPEQGGAMDDLYEISNLLNTGLDRETLAAAIHCIELGEFLKNYSMLIVSSFFDFFEELLDFFFPNAFVNVVSLKMPISFICRSIS